MFEIQRQKQKPIVVIRTATSAELTNYEKSKLASVEANAQENKIEAVSLSIDGNKQLIAPLNKEVTIDLGKLALESKVKPENISAEDVFVIQCALESAAFEIYTEQD